MKFLRRFFHATLLRQAAEKETTDSADLTVRNERLPSE